MGGRRSKSVETVKAESFEQSSLTDESMSIINMHAPSGFGGGDDGGGGVGVGVSRLWGGADEGSQEGGSQEGRDNAGDPQVTGIE